MVTKYPKQNKSAPSVVSQYARSLEFMFERGTFSLGRLGASFIAIMAIVRSISMIKSAARTVHPNPMVGRRVLIREGNNTPPREEPLAAMPIARD